MGHPSPALHWGPSISSGPAPNSCLAQGMGAGSSQKHQLLSLKMLLQRQLQAQREAVGSEWEEIRPIPPSHMKPCVVGDRFFCDGACRLLSPITTEGGISSQGRGTGANQRQLPGAPSQGKSRMFQRGGYRIRPPRGTPCSHPGIEQLPCEARLTKVNLFSLAYVSCSNEGCCALKSSLSSGSKTPCHKKVQRKSREGQEG